MLVSLYLLIPKALNDCLKSLQACWTLCDHVASFSLILSVSSFHTFPLSEDKQDATGFLQPLVIMQGHGN